MENKKNRYSFHQKVTDRFRSSLILVAVCSLGLLFTACGDNSTGTGSGNGDGDGTGNGNGNGSTEPTFSNVLNIFNNNCSGSGCHIEERNSGVRLDSYNNVIESEGAQYGELVVQPGDANGSPLVDKIESENPEFGDRMPVGGALSSSQISLIKEWIDDGAENN